MSNPAPRQWISPPNMDPYAFLDDSDADTTSASRQWHTTDAFISDLAAAKAGRLKAATERQRATNPFHLTDAGVKWLLVRPTLVFGLAVCVLFGATIAFW